MTWTNAMIRRARQAIDGFALEARDRVREGDWRVFWRDRVASASNLTRLLRDHSDCEVARCEEWMLSAEEILREVRQAHAKAVDIGNRYAAARELDRIKFHERSVKKLESRIRAAERMRALLELGIPDELVSYWPLGVDAP